MEKTSFGTSEQRGNVTIYPALPAEMLRATRDGKKKVAAFRSLGRNMRNVALYL